MDQILENTMEHLHRYYYTIKPFESLWPKLKRISKKEKIDLKSYIEAFLTTTVFTI